MMWDLKQCQGFPLKHSPFFKFETLMNCGGSTTWQYYNMGNVWTTNIEIYILSVFSKRHTSFWYLHSTVFRIDVLKYENSMLQNCCIILHIGTTVIDILNCVNNSKWKIWETYFKIHTKYCTLCSAGVSFPISSNCPSTKSNVLHHNIFTENKSVTSPKIKACFPHYMTIRQCTKRLLWIQ
jgi:hypothetical protein